MRDKAIETMKCEFLESFWELGLKPSIRTFYSSFRYFKEVSECDVVYVPYFTVTL